MYPNLNDNFRAFEQNISVTSFAFQSNNNKIEVKDLDYLFSNLRASFLLQDLTLSPISWGRWRYLSSVVN